jgi:two-component system sensor histidine kinase CpxA
MRSLFFKIFASFWICTVLVVALVMATAPRPDTTALRAAMHRGITPSVISTTQALAGAYENSGCAALERMAQSQEPGRMPLDLLDPQGNVLCDSKHRSFDIQPLPAPGTVDFRTVGADRFAVTGLFQGARGSYAGLLPLRRYEPPLVRGPIMTRLLLAITLSGLICAALARYLVRPITRLRSAAREIADGRLSARAGTGKKEQHDEVGQLVKDFDRMADRLEQLIDAQQRLISDVSHELRSPLTRLKLALELAQNDSNPDIAPTLKRIEREAERLNSLVGMLLTVSKLESTDAPPGTSSINVQSLLAEIMADVDIEARSRECTVTLDAPQECWLDANPDLLRSAFENVMRNAIRYTQPGTAVQVKATCRFEDSASVQVVVRDHGPGVPEAELPNVFKPFYRVDTSRERRTGGVGLGLAIAERAIKLHSGRIHAENAAGGGFAIIIELPLAPVAVHA